MISRGYVGLFSEPLQREAISQFVQSWIERFEKVEQLLPGDNNGTSALAITKPEELMWHRDMQFRVVNGIDFAWVYITLDRQVIETSGLPAEQISLCLDLLLELPGLLEVIDEHDDARLEILEKKGLL